MVEPTPPPIRWDSARQSQRGESARGMNNSLPVSGRAQTAGFNSINNSNRERLFKKDNRP